ncbi:calmodulin-lysine N-methyltransferase isoform X2 [Zingiber officinale]|uniref:calmodulin-lysine N-methyltransferase isoform X2 n=1 Tax=Zingiber officinale TaxID=94328 RepID=UPI001C4B6421|nr:calmodulin-lysine N-methyltransferase isoform X2 [Zingiber officinale]
MDDSRSSEAGLASAADSLPRRSHASLRWAILRRSLLPRPSSAASGHPSDMSTKKVSRKKGGGFNLIPCRPLVDTHLVQTPEVSRRVKILAGPRDACLHYKLPLENAPGLVMIQRMEESLDLYDFQISRQYDIDTTGLVCCWPSEDVLAWFCVDHRDMFGSKRVIELGSGYGLAGLAIAACSDAYEVVISDGNPDVVDYVQRNITVNTEVFGGTQVKSMTLHWNQDKDIIALGTFDIVLASDCTFFKEFHESLAHAVKCLLKRSEASQAIFLGPKRGNSLEKFLEKIKEIGLNYELVENYDSRVWNIHQKLLADDTAWPNYDIDHFYPLLLRITFSQT